MARTVRKTPKEPSLLAGTKKLRTVGDWLRFAVTSFTRAPLSFAQGLHGPQEEAMFLVGRFLGLEQEDLTHFLGARLTRSEIEELSGLIRGRVERRVPVPYLVHEAWLGGLRFFIDRRALIPRSYIAGLLPDAVAKFAGRGWSPQRILDIGTGCGCLAILAARAFPDAVVDAVDTSAEALAVAERNVADHGLVERVHLLQSDLFAALPSFPYDLIIANPPYEPTDVVTGGPAELKHEPVLALDGGADGMNCVRRILAEARAYLSPRGVLVLEHGDLRAAIATEFPGLEFHIFDLPDGSDAVIGVRTPALPAPANAGAQPPTAPRAKVPRRGGVGDPALPARVGARAQRKR
jgi:ribosomal protein L3 glutamine methyltransferase